MGQRASVSFIPSGSSTSAWLTNVGLHYATAQALLVINAVHYAMSCVAITTIYLLGIFVLSSKMTAYDNVSVPNSSSNSNATVIVTEFTDVVQSLLNAILNEVQNSNSTDTGLIDDYFVLYCNAIWAIFVLDAIILKNWTLSGPLLFVSLSSTAAALSATNEFARPNDVRRALSITSWDSSVHLSISATLVMYSSVVLTRRLKNKTTTLIMHVHLAGYWIMAIATRRSSLIAACTSFLMAIALFHVSDAMFRLGQTIQRGSTINGVDARHGHTTSIIMTSPVVVNMGQQSVSKPAVLDQFQSSSEQQQSDEEETQQENVSMLPVSVGIVSINSDNSGNPDNNIIEQTSCSTDSLSVSHPRLESQTDH